MRIDWMKNANEHNGTDQQKATIQKAAADLEWLAMPKKGESLSLPMMPGEGIKAAIVELKIPKVSHIAIGNDLAPYGFYGIRASYKNADVEVFLIDAGTYMAPLCAYVTEKPTPAKCTFPAIRCITA